MTSGILAGVLLLLLFTKFVTKRLSAKPIDCVNGKIHPVLGFALLGILTLHLILVLPLFRQRPLVMYLFGVIMVLLALIGAISYLIRRKLGRKWLVVHRIAAALLLALIMAHIAVGIGSLQSYQSQVAAITVGQVNLSSTPDGIYEGEEDVGYIYARVRVTVSSGKITDVTILEHRTEHGRPAETLAKRIVAEQSISVDAVSGATNSSKVIMKACENALTGQ